MDKLKIIPPNYSGGNTFVLFGKRAVVLPEHPTQEELDAAVLSVIGNSEPCKNKQAENKTNKPKKTSTKKETTKKENKDEGAITFESLFGDSTDNTSETEESEAVLNVHSVPSVPEVKPVEKVSEAKESVVAEETTKKVVEKSSVQESEEKPEEADIEHKSAYVPVKIISKEDAMSYVLTSGKHKGQRLGNIAVSDPSYIRFLAESTNGDPNVKRAAVILIRDALSLSA